jgi:hypothetical protein
VRAPRAAWWPSARVACHAQSTLSDLDFNLPMPFPISIAGKIARLKRY